MANLLKVVLVPDNNNQTTAPAGVKYLSIKDLIKSNDVGTKSNDVGTKSNDAGAAHLSLPLADRSVAIWHCNLSLETLPQSVALTELFTEIARASVDNARLVITARHPFHDSFVDDESCVRPITINKLKAILAQTNEQGAWWYLLNQLVLEPEFLPELKNLESKQLIFELRTRRNVIKHSRLGVMVKNHNTEPQFISCYADVAGVPPFPFTVYRDWQQDKYLSPEIVMTGQWEPQETHLLLNLMRGLQQHWGASEAERPLKFFNVGGNLGWYCALVLNANEHSQVTAFEPVKSNFSLLERNVAPHADRAHLNNFALSDTTGEANFFIEKGNFGGSSLVARESGTLSQVTVPLHTFDELYAEADVPNLCDLMVMDIEGAEHKFFNGARNLFERGFSPIMMLEYNPGMLKLQGSDGTFVNDLAHWGYQFYVINRQSGTLSLIDAAGLLQHFARLFDTEAYLNYLAVPAKYDLAHLLQVKVQPASTH